MSAYLNVWSGIFCCVFSSYHVLRKILNKHHVPVEIVPFLAHYFQSGSSAKFVSRIKMKMKIKIKKFHVLFIWFKCFLFDFIRKNVRFLQFFCCIYFQLYQNMVSLFIWLAIHSINKNIVKCKKKDEKILESLWMMKLHLNWDTN